MALNPVTELEAIVDVLNTDGVPYALCGALALGVHGYPRATKDIDLLVEAADVERALAAVNQVGFDTPARNARARSGKRRICKVEPRTGDLMPLDVLIVGDELLDVWNSRITVDTGSRRLTLVSRDGLVTMKRIAGRLQDLADLAKLAGTDDEEG